MGMISKAKEKQTNKSINVVHQLKTFFQESLLRSLRVIILRTMPLNF